MVTEMRNKAKLESARPVNRGGLVFDIINYTLLTMLSLCCIYPFLYILFASFSNPLLLMKHSGILYAPLGFTLKGYEMVLRNPNIASGYKNTLFYVIVGTFVNIVMTSLGAYAVSRKKFIFRRYIMMFIVFTMFFYGGLIPIYLLVKSLGMIDKRIALIVPTAVATWNLVIMRTSFMQIPDSLEESARLDGANDLTILVRIILPVSKATVAVLILFYAVGRWNEWFWAMVFLKDRAKYPLQLILREILIINNPQDMTNAMINPQEEDMYRELLKYTTVVVAIFPILLLYPYLQKYFVKGVMVGSLKG